MAFEHGNSSTNRRRDGTAPLLPGYPTEPCSPLSVVICAYTFDRLSDVLAAIESVERQDMRPSEIIVVVDHNPPLLAVIGETAPSGVVVAENRFERGLSGARNSGIALASGSLVAFLDDDAIADPTCLRHLSDRCRELDVIGAGALIEPDWPGLAPSWFPGEFLWVVGCSYVGLEPGPTRNLLGAAMCNRRGVFAEVGGFDGGLGRRQTNLPFGCEETELCIRATRAFVESHFVFEPAARVLHKVSPDRVSWSYFVKRCYAEGLSKAHLSRLVGADRSLSNESQYVRRTLPRSIVRNFGDAFVRGDLWGLARVAAVLTGLGCAGAGFALGRLGTGRQFSASDAPAASAQAAASRSISPIAGRRSSGRSALTMLRDRFIATLRPHLSLFSNAGLLGLGTGAASVLGFFYWWFAARTFPAAAVGYAAAAISLLNFIGHVGETGLGALLIGDIHRFKERSGALVSGAMIVSAGCSILFGLGYVGISALFPLRLGGVADVWGSSIFVIGCGLTGMTLVLDQALVGMLRSQLQLLRNVSFAAVKLALLAALPLWAAMSGLNEVNILGTWILGQVASMLLLVAAVGRGLGSVFGRPDIGLLKPLVVNAIGHHGLNLANLAPGLLMPFVVTTELAPSINAAFYAAWTVINVAYLVPASLATVVFAVGAKDPQGLSAKIRASLGTSLAVGLLVAMVCYFAADLILATFSPNYAHVAGRSFSLLGLSILPVAIKYHYVSIQRLRNHMLGASLLVGLGCAIELTGAIVGGANGDLFGLSVGWMIGLCAETALMTPVVLGALLPPAGSAGRRPAAKPRPSGFIPLGLARGDSES